MKLFTRSKRKDAAKPAGDPPPAAVETVPASSPPGPRDDDAIYQDSRVVARVSGAHVDWESKEIRFAEIANSDELVLPEECEFQKYKIMVQRIGYASKAEKAALHKGRVLREVVAEILGYREQ